MDFMVEELIYKVLKVMEDIGGGDTIEDFIWRKSVCRTFAKKKKKTGDKLVKWLAYEVFMMEEIYT